MKWLSARSHAPIIKITIKDPKPSYTTWDRIEGIVTVAAPNDTNVNNIQITMEGSSRVALPRPITELREPAACQTFLKLQQPIETPISPTHVSGRTYSYPFSFVIPEELPLGSCIHEKSNGWADHRHAKLPPTLRFANLSQELCRIAYYIRATVFYHRVKYVNNERTTTSTRDLRFVPAHESNHLPRSLQTFISLQHNPKQDVKSKASLSPGRLSVEGSSAQLTQGRCLEDFSNGSFDAYLTIPLRFEAAGEAKPPQLRHLHCTLKASTFLATRVTAKRLKHHEAQYRQAHVENIAMRSEDISSTQWIKHEPTPEDYVTEHQSGNTLYYTTSIHLPMRMPRNGHLIPFSTCLLSRAYLVDMRMSYSTPDSSGRRRSLNATLPVKIAESYETYVEKRPLWNTLDEPCLSDWDAEPPPYHSHELSRSSDVVSLRKGQHTGVYHLMVDS
ncbi:uncharacterized protein BO88DRAFT_474530 [Aspergillus vadensis CBS 113365]|uniref:Arrestin-like N-terminal domain-containing protein n=1 Tax=Aspergillus vadensis (strain CBS 113365 / IMI 142717 / IBT 24658) TaxID=1448311 RepID=A0A319C667_ASPVC|nr:hypothetical protein BO88DRAFT_474530 [Aspergillus vadensis CBS 113365]PYH64322.1 hypothetical protein BO88DRAFT_474530 [Aspergillus vadensis CBS 113365]